MQQNWMGGQDLSRGFWGGIKTWEVTVGKCFIKLDCSFVSFPFRRVFFERDLKNRGKKNWEISINTNLPSVALVHSNQ